MSQLKYCYQSLAQFCNENGIELCIELCRDYSGELFRRETRVLDELIINEKVDESDIIIGSQYVPEIWYLDNSNKKHRFYVDIYIPSQNKCIEVKSLYTYKKNEAINLLKQDATKNLGYNYEFWVYNKKGEKINCYA